jgi:hypothetical protein
MLANEQSAMGNQHSAEAIEFSNLTAVCSLLELPKGWLQSADCF